MAEAAYRTILERQQDWAKSARIDLDDLGHVRHWPDNLFAPLDDRSLAELEASRRQPFGDADKPGPLHVLHSTLALLASAFGYWRQRDAAPLASALGLECDVTDVRLAPVHACGMDDGHVELDVEIELGGSPRVAVCASYAEPYQQIDPRLPSRQASAAGFADTLHGCRLLADDVRFNPGRYARLAVGRLLEHIQALAHTHGSRGFRLLVLWHELPGRESRELQAELARLRSRIGGEVDLDVMTWASLVERIGRNHPEHVAYTQYLESRYLAQEPLLVPSPG